MNGRPWLLGLLAAFLCGLWVGSRQWNRAVASVAPGPLPAQRLAPGSLVLERVTEKPAGDLPRIPEGATVSRVAWADVEPVEPLKKIRVNVVELETNQGPRLQIQTNDGKIIGGQDYIMRRPGPGPWGMTAGAIVNQNGIHPAAGLTYTRGRWTFGTMAGIKSGPTWPGGVIYANFRF